MGQRWSWDDATSDWGVDLDEAAGKLRWWGADKPRPDVPAHAQGGGEVDQSIDELLTTHRSPYACPAPILAEVVAAALATRTASAEKTLDVAAGDRTDERILEIVHAAFRAIMDLGDARVLVGDEEVTIPDDRPEQSAGDRRTRTWRVGDALDLTLAREWTPWGGVAVKVMATTEVDRIELAYRNELWKLSGTTALVDSIARALARN